MTCKNCPYHFKADDDRFPCCHFESVGDWDKAPCEWDEEPEEPEDYGYLMED